MRPSDGAFSERSKTPNPSQASVVKRADECPTGAGWPSVKHRVNRHDSVFAADFISIAGHSLWAAPNIYGLLPVASRVSSDLTSKVKIAHIYPAAEVEP